VSGVGWVFWGYYRVLSHGKFYILLFTISVGIFVAILFFFLVNWMIFLKFHFKALAVTVEIFSDDNLNLRRSISDQALSSYDIYAESILGGSDVCSAFCITTLPRFTHKSIVGQQLGCPRIRGHCFLIASGGGTTEFLVAGVHSHILVFTGRNCPQPRLEFTGHISQILQMTYLRPPSVVFQWGCRRLGGLGVNKLWRPIDPSTHRPGALWVFRSLI
jgi:hypothetical protein